MSTKAIEDFVLGYPRCLRQLNLLVLLAVGGLLTVGILFVYGAGQQSGGGFAHFWRKQLVWLFLGSSIALLVIRLDYGWMDRFWWVPYGGSIFLLVLVLLVGTPINGARSWLSPDPRITIQPSEFAKIGLIVALSWLISRPWLDLRKFRWIALTLAVAALPILLIAIQPDYGSALTLIPITLGLLYLGGLPKRWIAYGLILGIAVGPFAYTFGFSNHQCRRIQTFAAPYTAKLSDEQRQSCIDFVNARFGFLPESRQERLRDLVNPMVNIRDAGWNAHQSLLAVGSGGLTGKGFGQGTQNPLGFLPRPVTTTDFIFSVIAEETGFLGSALVIGLFLLLVCTAIYIGTKARDDFGRYMAYAISVLLSIHIYVNIGMTIGMAPIIGIPLPFVSYGGSFMLAMLLAIGILQSVYVHRHGKGMNVNSEKALY